MVSGRMARSYSTGEEEISFTAPRLADSNEEPSKMRPGLESAAEAPDPPATALAPPPPLSSSGILFLLQERGGTTHADLPKRSFFLNL